MYCARPGGFEYHRAASVDEAVGLLAELEDARPLAGGHSLLPAMKLRLSVPAALVDIGRLPGLDAIERDGDTLRIGALATHAAVAASQLVQQACPLLAETAAQIGDPQVRNRGTIGGSLAHADPGADYPTAVTALGATIEATGPGGGRELAAGEFFRGLFTTALEPAELLTAVRIPDGAARSGSAYVKHKHPASGYAVAAAAAVVAVEDGACSSARLAIGGVAVTPVDASAAVADLVGGPPDEDALASAAGGVVELLGGALGDTYASAEYRRTLAQALARRALAAAFARA